MGLVTDLDLPGFTSGTIDGTGVFDVLMKATRAHLKEEYTKGRVKGSDYAQLVSNVTVAVLQQAVALYTQSEIGKNNIEKIQAEINLLEQKFQTEKAQTEGKVQKVAGVWDLLPEADPLHVGGKIGQEMILHATQADGFLRDAEQKATKMVLDTWNIRRSTDTGTIPSATSNITDVEIGKFVQKMGDGINISV